MSRREREREMFFIDSLGLQLGETDHTISYKQFSGRSGELDRTVFLHGKTNDFRLSWENPCPHDRTRWITRRTRSIQPQL